MMKNQQLRSVIKYCALSVSVMCTAGVASATDAPILMNKAFLAEVKASLPKVNDEQVNALLNDTKTFFYDDDAIDPMYQDAVQPVVGMRHPSEGLDLSRTQGGEVVFDSEHFRFPFRHTAGTDSARGVRLVKFLRLPDRNENEFWEILVFTDGHKGQQWVHPIGTVYGEIMYLTDSVKNALRVFEIRTLTREAEGWAPEVFRPFPEAGGFADWIEALDEKLITAEQKAVALKKLRDATGFQNATLNSHLGIPNLRGGLDEVPALPEAVVTLALQQPFEPSQGLAWKHDGQRAVYAPTVTSGYSIVPPGYNAGALPIDATSCQSCHVHTSRAIGSFNERTVLYGTLWGSDRIWSFHPFAGYSTSLRSDFVKAGMVKHGSPSQGPADKYTRLSGDGYYSGFLEGGSGFGSGSGQRIRGGRRRR